MNIVELIKQRHSVRSYIDKTIDKDTIEQLEKEIVSCNKQGDLHFQLFTESKKFNSFFAHYGNFKNVRNYIALIGKDSEELDERVGYYGEQIVLKAQELGLNTCWVAGMMKKRLFKTYWQRTKN